MRVYQKNGGDRKQILYGHADFKPSWWPTSSPIDWSDVRNPRKNFQFQTEYVKTLVIRALTSAGIPDCQVWVEDGVDIRSYERKQAYKRRSVPVAVNTPVVSPQSSPVMSPHGSPVVPPQGPSVVSPQGSSVGSPKGSSVVSPEWFLSWQNSQRSSVVPPQRSSVVSPQGSSVVSPQGSSVVSPISASITNTPTTSDGRRPRPRSLRAAYRPAAVLTNTDRRDQREKRAERAGLRAARLFGRGRRPAPEVFNQSIAAKRSDSSSNNSSQGSNSSSSSVLTRKMTMLIRTKKKN